MVGDGDRITDDSPDEDLHELRKRGKELRYLLELFGSLFADDAHVEVEATWGVYQRMIAAYRHEDRQRGRELMEKLITDLSAGVPKVLTELTSLGRAYLAVAPGRQCPCTAA